MLTTSGSNSSSSRRVLLGRKSRWEESEDGGERQTFVDVATGSAESAGLRQGRDEDLRSQRSTDAGSRALPSDGATPRQSSSARMPSSSTSQSASGSTAAHSLQPARPPKAVDRSPSGSTYSSSMTSNARYATPPSGGASPAAGGSTPLPDVTDNIPNGPDDDDDDIPNGSNPKRISYLRAGGTASSPDLKTLVSKKSQMAQANAVGEPPSNEHHSSSSAGTARRAEPRSSSSVEQASSPPPLAGPQYYSPVPQRPEKSRTQSAATMSASSRPRSRTTGGPDNQGRASKEQSNAPPLPFPRGSTVQEGAEVADDGRYNSQAGSLGSRGSAVSPSSRDREPVGLPESVSLAEEIAQGSPQPETHSSGAFKERMKKTSGFLKKLRGDSSKEEKRERERAEKAVSFLRPDQRRTKHLI